MSVLLKDIPKSEKPRERLLAAGSEALSNEELLSIILRTGVKGQSVCELSREILSKVSDIRDLKDIRLNTLKSVRGLGMTKSVTLLAALELGRRVYETDVVKEKIIIKTAADAYRYFAKYIVLEKQENFMVVFLDKHKRYIDHKIIFKGTIDASIVHPREVMKEALLSNALGIILMHNHPSGVTRPSKADDETTGALLEAGEIMGIQVLDHLIVSEKDYYSYQEEGRIKYV